MKNTQKEFLQYAAWNGMVVGALILSTIFKLSIMQVVVAWFFGLEAVFYVLFCASENLRKELYAKTPSLRKFYKLFTEVLFIGIAFLLKQYFVASCMIITYFGYVYLYAGYKEGVLEVVANENP